MLPSVSMPELLRCYTLRQVALPLQRLANEEVTDAVERVLEHNLSG